MLILFVELKIDWSTYLECVELEIILMHRLMYLKIPLDCLELIVDLLDQLECFISFGRMCIFISFSRMCIFSLSLKTMCILHLEVIRK